MGFLTASKPILLKRGRNRKSRPKTFKTEEAAKKYAEVNKIKKYALRHLTPAGSSKKKIQIIVSNE